MPMPRERETSLATGMPAPWAPPALLGVLFALLAAWSWGKWADPIVDFGNEPYLSWQLLAGRALHRDLVSLYGPLSPWVNALWFTLFGASLRTLAVCNLVLAACLAAVVYRFVEAATDRMTATTATTVLLVSFVFPHHAEDAANYDFVWPYTHAATHGTILLVCGIAALARAVVSDRTVAWAIAGTLLATTALTKPEIALAAALTGVVGMGWHMADGGAQRLRGPLVVVAAGVVPIVACILLLGVDEVTMPWAAVARVAGREHTFASSLMGTDDWRGNAVRVVIDAILWSIAAVALIAADGASAAMSRERRRWIAIAGVAVVGALIVRDLPGVGRPLPVLVPIAAGVLAWIAWRRPAERSRLVPLVLWATAAWVLLGRMLLNVHFHHYGFYLAMPAAVLVVTLGVGTIPRLLADRTPDGGRLVRTVALATIGLLLAYSIGLSASSYANMTVPIGRGANAMLGPDADVSPTGALAAALEERIARMPPGATLAVLPQGALLAFIARRPNPTPYHDLMPPIFTTFGVEQVLAAYEARPPQYVVLVAWSGHEYGVATFGSPGWGSELAQWVARRYEQIDATPTTPTTIGFSIWRRLD
jgi:hypothetical protein